MGWGGIGVWWDGVGCGIGLMWCCMDSMGQSGVGREMGLMGCRMDWMGWGGE